MKTGFHYDKDRGEDIAEVIELTAQRATYFNGASVPAGFSFSVHPHAPMTRGEWAEFVWAARVAGEGGPWGPEGEGISLRAVEVVEYRRKEDLLAALATLPQ